MSRSCFLWVSDMRVHNNCMQSYFLCLIIQYICNGCMVLLKIEFWQSWNEIWSLPFLFSCSSWKLIWGQGYTVHFLAQLLITHPSLHPGLMLGGHFMWLLDSNSTKVANTNKYQTGIVQRVPKRCESPPRYSSISCHPQSPAWCLIIIWDRG